LNQFSGAYLAQPCYTLDHAKLGGFFKQKNKQFWYRVALRAAKPPDGPTGNNKRCTVSDTEASVRSRCDSSCESVVLDITGTAMLLGVIDS
jgi:hypothetical protein